MKYAVFFLLCCLALVSAAPQLVIWPRPRPTLEAASAYAGGFYNPAFGRTVVAGPQVYNGFGASLVAPGYIGSAFY